MLGPSSILGVKPTKEIESGRFPKATGSERSELIDWSFEMNLTCNEIHHKEVILSESNNFWRENWLLDTAYQDHKPVIKGYRLAEIFSLDFTRLEARIF